MSSKSAALPASKSFSLQRRMALLLAAAAFLLYANTFSNGYVLDDTTAITNNSIVAKGISGIPEIFSTPYLYGALHNPNDLYRPLSLVTFAIEQQLFDGSPGPSHVVNVLVFCCCVLLLFYFLDELFERRKTSLAFLAALLFAFHPIHTEVVANIKSRDELLCFAFAFAALLYWLRYARGGGIGQLAIATAFYFLSLFSKETSLSFIVLLPLLFFFWESSSAKRRLIISASTIGTIAVYLLIRFSVLNAHDANHPFSISITENALAAANGWSQRIATAVLTSGMYLKLLIVPYPLRCDYAFNTVPLTSFSDWRVLLSLAVYLGMFFAGIWLLMKRRKDVPALAILFFLITFSIFSNLFFLVGATMAERFLFFPSVGFCLLAAYFINKLAKEGSYQLTGKRILLVLGPILAIYSILTIQRNSQWKDGFTLYKTDLEHTPHNYRLPYYLASISINAANEESEGSVQRTELLQDAIGYLKQSIAVYPYFNTTQAQAGITYMNLGKTDSAERHILNAISLNDRDTFSRNNLAAIYFKQGRYRESIAQCRENLRLYPGYVRAYLNIGACYLRLGAADSAKGVLQNALALDPNNQTAAYYLSVANNMAQKEAPTSR